MFTDVPHVAVADDGSVLSSGGAFLQDPATPVALRGFDESGTELLARLDGYAATSAAGEVIRVSRRHDVWVLTGDVPQWGDPSLMLRLFGSWAIMQDGRVVEDRIERAHDLLMLLAVSPGSRLSRHQAAAALWPDSPPERARAALKQLVRRARGLGGAFGLRESLISEERGVLMLNTSLVGTDVGWVMWLWDVAMRLVASGDDRGCGRVCHDLLDGQLDGMCGGLARAIDQRLGMSFAARRWEAEFSLAALVMFAMTHAAKVSGYRAAVDLGMRGLRCTPDIELLFWVVSQYLWAMGHETAARDLYDSWYVGHSSNPVPWEQARLLISQPPSSSAIPRRSSSSSR